MTGPITLRKIHEVIPIILIFVAFNDTAHLATGLLSKLRLGSEKQKQTKKNIDSPGLSNWTKSPPKHTDTICTLLTLKAAEADKWGHGYLLCMLSVEGGKTTAGLCDINARVTATGETTTINIEILSDTSKLVRNEPLYL